MSYRFTSHNKALHCYIILSIWILLVIAGIYKYFEWNRDEIGSSRISTENYQNFGIGGVKTKRIIRLCNFPEDIYQGDEGIQDTKTWALKGLIVLIRHGDRGPLQHVKKIANINCNAQESNLLKTYKSYLYNLTVTGKVQWTGPGPFHGFPVLPLHPDQCQLGQLTTQGVSQHLNLGKMLQNTYREIWPKLLDLKQEEVLVYSTRYRRTFQSGLAFLYGLIAGETLSKVSIFESHSMSFCFKDCECPVTETLKKQVQKSESHQLKSHPAIETLSLGAGRLLFSSEAEQTSLVRDPFVIRDALLAFVCHRARLPCENDVQCIRKQNVAGIIAYTDWVNYQKWRNIFWKRLCLLRSYGHIRHLVQQMLHMVGSNGPHLVLYSGHDYTLLQLATALGLGNDPLLLRYASRLIFEIYQKNSDEERGVYFRVLSNGRDVTRQVGFCKNLVNVDKKTSLCKIEDIVRFLHDDYFSSLNVTNFKDACVRNGEGMGESEFFQFK